jgi:preprotein translocase subunit YajC
LQFLIVIVLLLGVMWFLVVRPQKRRQAQQAQLLSAVAEGDEILTAGGVYGTVRAVEDDSLSLEIAPGTIIRVARRAVAARIEPEDEPDDGPEDVDGEAPEHDGDGAEPLDSASAEPHRR